MSDDSKQYVIETEEGFELLITKEQQQQLESLLMSEEGREKAEITKIVSYGSQLSIVMEKRQ